LPYLVCGNVSLRPAPLDERHEVGGLGDLGGQWTEVLADTKTLSLLDGNHPLPT